MSASKHRRQPTPVKVQKIDDITVEQSINHIADSTAQNAGQRKRKELLSGV